MKPKTGSAKKGKGKTTVLYYTRWSSNEVSDRDSDALIDAERRLIRAAARSETLAGLLLNVSATLAKIRSEQKLRGRREKSNA